MESHLFDREFKNHCMEMGAFEAAKYALREMGYIIEKQETLSLPVHVARSGSLGSKDGYTVKLHVRANIGGKMAQCDYAVDATTLNRMPDNVLARGIVGSISHQFSRHIMDELEPQIFHGISWQIEQAMKGD